ncbi:MAG: hypothetical protein ACRC4M_02950 [Mycoplasma sp.]
MLLNTFLSKTKQQNSFPHSLIIKANFCCDYKDVTKSYLKTLVCSNATTYCDECNLCSRVNADSYLDLIYFDNQVQEMTKEDVINIQSVFSKPSSEDVGIKLYVIKNIEKTSKHVLNSLLKFIEDSPSNTFLLMFTKNQNQVLSTILSRSSVITIDDHINKFDNGDTELNKILEYIFDDYSYYTHFINQYNLDDIYKMAMEMNKNFSSKSEILFLNKLKDFDKEELYIFLKILIHISQPQTKIQLLKLLPKIKLNLNKRILAFKIIDITSSSWKQ